jgi:DNA-binding GntR family transcriptional regulator
MVECVTLSSRGEAGHWLDAATASDGTRGRPGDSAERAYQEIRRSISTGEHRPGTRLTEGSLSKALSMSRTPVRTALVRLDAEGFVTMTPKRGAVVAADTTVDVIELLQIREALETQAASVAASSATPHDVAALTANVDEMETIAVESSGDAAAIALGHDFHLLVASMSRRPRLASLVSGLHQLIHDTVGCGSTDVWQYTVAQHRELVVALEQHDAEWAEAAMRSHLRFLQHRSIALARQGRRGA